MINKYVCFLVQNERASLKQSTSTVWLKIASRELVREGKGHKQLSKCNPIAINRAIILVHKITSKSNIILGRNNQRLWEKYGFSYDIKILRSMEKSKSDLNTHVLDLWCIFNFLVGVQWLLWTHEEHFPNLENLSTHTKHVQSCVLQFR